MSSRLPGGAPGFLGLLENHRFIGAKLDIQADCNRQFATNIVVGLEATLTSANLNC